MMRKKFITITLLALLSCQSFAGNWSYKKQEDKMSGKEIKTAYIYSENSLSLGFPYHGKNHGSLDVRRHPKYGLDVIIGIQKGQILCTLGCTGAVRFDDGKPQKVKLVPSADHSSEVVFLSNPKSFIASAAKAKKILVQIPIYQEGEQVLEFQTEAPLRESLQWEDPPQKKNKSTKSK